MTRRRVLIAVVALVAAFLGYRAWRSYTAPEPPAIDYAGIDPDVAAAVEAARLSVRDHPRSGEHWGRYGMVLGAHGFTEASIQCFDFAARYDDSNSRWPHLEAIQLLNANKAHAAFPHMRRALSLATTRDERAMLLFYIATTHINLGELEEAASVSRELETVEPDSVRDRFVRGLLAFARGKPDEARPLLESVANEPALRKQVCKLLAQTGDPNQWAARHQQCGRLPPDEAWHNTHYAEMMKYKVTPRDRLEGYFQLQQQGRADEAREYLERLNAETPDAATNFLLGYERMTKKEYRAATEAFQASLKFDSQNARAYLNLAMMQFELGEFRPAADSAAKAVAIQANLTAALSLRGRALKRLKLTEESLQAFRDAVTGQPESAELHRELGEELAEAGQVAEGLGHLEDAVRLAPPGDAPRYQMAFEKWKGKKK